MLKWPAVARVIMPPPSLPAAKLLLAPESASHFGWHQKGPRRNDSSFSCSQSSQSDFGWRSIMAGQSGNTWLRGERPALLHQTGVNTIGFVLPTRQDLKPKKTLPLPRCEEWTSALIQEGVWLPWSRRRGVWCSAWEPQRSQRAAVPDSGCHVWLL